MPRSSPPGIALPNSARQERTGSKLSKCFAAPSANSGCAAIFPPLGDPPNCPGAILDLPSEHRIPVTWLLQNAGASIRYRTYRELAPEGYAPPDVVQPAHLAIAESKTALAVVKK